MTHAGNGNRRKGGSFEKSPKHPCALYPDKRSTAHTNTLLIVHACLRYPCLSSVGPLSEFDSNENPLTRRLLTVPRPTEDSDCDLPRSKCLVRGENVLSLRSLSRRGTLVVTARPSDSSGNSTLAVSPTLPPSPPSSLSPRALFQGTAPTLEVIALKYRE